MKNRMNKFMILVVKGLVKVRTTLNISDDIIKETEVLYSTTNRSKAVENALKDAIRFKKIIQLMELKGKLEFDEKFLDEQGKVEINEAESTF